MSKKRLHEVLSLETGLFRHIEDPIWLERYDQDDMDLEFITSFGDKPIAPLVKHFTREGPLTEESASRIINLIYNKYRESWERQYEVLGITYEILDNYLMIETEKIDRDTLENNLSDILKNNTYSKNEINDLMEKIKKSEKNSLNRTESERYVDDKTRDETQEEITTKDGRNIQSNEDRLSFIDRKDTESRDTVSERQKEERDGTVSKETLSFEDRKSNTKDNNTRNEESTEHVSSEGTEKGTNNEDDNRKVYGFNSSRPVPESEEESMNRINNTKENEEERTVNGTTSDDRNIETSQSGREVTSVDSDTNRTGSEKDTNREDAITSKTGEEVTKTSVDSTDREDGTSNTTVTGNENLKGSRDGSVNDVGEGEGTSDTTSNIEKKEVGEELESQQMTSNTNGEMSEERELTRRGNLGVTTTAQILQQHIDFWQYNFLDQVYRDTVKMMTLDIY